MPTVSATSGITVGSSVDRINLDYPTNDTTNVIFAAVVVTYSSPPTINTPSGWTLITTATGDSVNTIIGLYWKAGDGSTGSQAFTFGTSSSYSEGAMIVFADCNATSPFDGPASSSNTATTTHTVSQITTSVVNELLVGFWLGALSPLAFFPSMTTLLSIDSQSSPAFNLPWWIATEQWAPASATGSRTATTIINQSSRALLLGFKPYPGPSIPVLTYPVGGEQLVAGAAVTTTWTASTSPTAAASTLKYNLDYSANNGTSWTSIVALTSTGAVSQAWTVPATVGSGYMIRIRSNDPAAALYSLGYRTSAAFSVVAETKPGAPVITAPIAGSSNNKAVNVTVSWQHQGGSGNPQTAYTLQWANNAAFTSPTTVGPTSTATQSTTIDFSAQTAGTTIYLKVKTVGVSIYSDYSAIDSFVVASLPATPNITAPTAGSPPTTPLPAITFTESDVFVSRKIRITQGGVEVYNSGDVTSTALSFTSPYSFLNSTAYTLFLSVKNAYGLASAEDSETFTAAYSGPATPTLGVNASNSGGYVQLIIANSDTPSYNELWRYVATAASSTAIKIGALLPKSATFNDFQAASGVGYKYFARAYASTGLFSDSSVSSTTTLTLPNVFLHAVSRTSVTSNTDGVVSLLNVTTQWIPEEVRAEVNLIGRSAPASLLGQAISHRLSVTANTTDYTDVTAVLAIWRKQETGSVLCVRDHKGNRVFGKMSQPGTVDQSNYLAITFEVIESAVTEGL